MTNKVFIATSLDGYIADKNNQVDWLQSTPNPKQSDMGYAKHMDSIDGGVTIQNFLKQDLIDEMIITIFPLLLGDGIPLFGELQQPLRFKCVETTQLIGAVCQSRYVREK